MKNEIRKRLAMLLSATLVLSSGNMTALATEVDSGEPEVAVEAQTEYEEPEVAQVTETDTKESEEVKDQDTSKKEDIVGGNINQAQEIKADGTVYEVTIPAPDEEAGEYENGHVWYKFTSGTSKFYSILTSSLGEIEANGNIYEKKEDGSMSEVTGVYCPSTSNRKSGELFSLEASKEYYIDFWGKEGAKFSFAIYEGTDIGKLEQVNVKKTFTAKANQLCYTTFIAPENGDYTMKYGCSEKQEAGENSYALYGYKKGEDNYINTYNDGDFQAHNETIKLEKDEVLTLFIQNEEEKEMYFGMDKQIELNYEGNPIDIEFTSESQTIKVKAEMDGSAIYNIYTKEIGEKVSKYKRIVIKDDNGNTVQDNIFVDWDQSFLFSTHEKYSGKSVYTFEIYSDIPSKLNFSLNKVDANEVKIDEIVKNSDESEKYYGYSFTAPEDGEYEFIGMNKNCNFYVEYFDRYLQNIPIRHTTLGYEERDTFKLEKDETIYIYVSRPSYFKNLENKTDDLFKVSKKTWEMNYNLDEKKLMFEGTGEVYISYGMFIDSDYLKDIETISFGEGITAAKGKAELWRFEKVKKIEFPKTLTTIGSFVFSNINSIKEIAIEGNIKSIEYAAFSNCNNLASVKIGSKVSKIEHYAFSGCGSLKKITVSSSNKYFATINNVLTSKDKTKLLFYPNGLKATSYTVPKSIKTINEYAFNNGKIKTITLGAKVSSLGKDSYGLRNLHGLETIKVDKKNKTFKAKSGVLFSKNGKKVICYPRAKKGNYSIPKGVTEIAYAAFGCNYNLKEVNIPSTVKKIGKQAFAQCGNLGGVIIPNGVTTIKDSTFAWCYRLDTVVIPKSVKTIETGAFLSCSCIKDVYYLGTKSGWSSVKKGKYNDYLTNAKMHYGKFSKKAQVIDSDDEYRIYLNSPQSLYLYAPGKLTFKSSNTKVAKVDSNGRVTPVKEGTCTITVNASATSIFKAAKKTIKIKVVK